MLLVSGARVPDQFSGKRRRFRPFDPVPGDLAGEHIHHRVEPVGVFSRAVEHRDVPAPELVRGGRVHDGFDSFGTGSRALFAAVAVLSVPGHDAVGGGDREEAVPGIEHPVVGLGDGEVGVFPRVQRLHERPTFGVGDAVRIGPVGMGHQDPRRRGKLITAGWSAVKACALVGVHRTAWYRHLSPSCGTRRHRW